MNNDIPERIFEQINFVASYADDCDDWVSIKKQVLLGIPSSLRKLFSTRDSKTKEQNLNDFEKTIINYYKTITGINLKVRTLEERRNLQNVS